jgi:hypothetical protein
MGSSIESPCFGKQNIFIMNEFFSICGMAAVECGGSTPLSEDDVCLSIGGI